MSINTNNTIQNDNHNLADYSKKEEELKKLVEINDKLGEETTDIIDKSPLNSVRLTEIEKEISENLRKIEKLGKEIEIEKEIKRIKLKEESIINKINKLKEENRLIYENRLDLKMRVDIPDERTESNNKVIKELEIENIKNLEYLKKLQVM